jgi:hypothetical protein
MDSRQTVNACLMMPTNPVPGLLKPHSGFMVRKAHEPVVLVAVEPVPESIFMT